jgi:hypothetical protein
MDREWSRPMGEKFELVHVEFKISLLIQLIQYIKNSNDL